MRPVILWRTVVASLFLLIAVASATPVHPAEPVARVAHSTLPALRGAAYVARAARSRQLEVAVTLRSQNPQGLAEFNNELYDPSSPNYHQFLTPEQFADEFGPTEEDYNYIKDYLRSYGLLIIQEYANHLVIDAAGSVTQVERAFGVHINKYSIDGREFIANDRDVQLPASIAAIIADVSGLQDYLKLTPHLEPGPHESRSRVGPGTPVGYSPQQIATAYDFSGAYSAGYTGTGKTIAIATAYGFSASDVSSFFSQFSLSVPSYSVVTVDGTPTSTNVESTLDLQRSGAMAYGATIIVYEGVNANLSTFEDVYNSIASNQAVSVVTTSWGLCEQEMPATNLNADHQIFMSAASEGQAWFAASGDNGADDCGNRRLAVDYPSSDSYVAAAGGTSLSLTGGNTISSETAWSYSGGGVSAEFTKPSYQSGFSGSYRQTADVAFAANPNTGYPVMYGGRWAEYGGTSFAAPQWAAAYAIAEQYNGSSLGAANPALYGLNGDGFHDITSGSNGHYSAALGWDNPTGWGSPDVWALAKLLK